MLDELEKILKRKRVLIPLILILAFVSYIGIKEYYDTCYISTNCAYIEGRSLDVSSRVSGVVQQVYIEENQEVKKGDLLVEVDSKFYEFQLREAETKLRQLKAKYDYNEVAIEDDDIKVVSDKAMEKEEQNRLNQGLIHSDYGKYGNVYGKGLIPQKKYEKRRLRANLTSAEEKDEKGVNLSKEETEEVEEIVDLEALSKEIKQQEAIVADAKLNLSSTKIYAPQDGVITGVNVKQGDFVEVEQKVFSFVPKNVWVSANYSRSYIPEIRAGQEVRVKIDMYPRKRFKAMDKQLSLF